MGGICTRRITPEAEPVRLSSSVIYAHGDSTVSVKSSKRNEIFKKYLSFSFASRNNEVKEESSDEVDDRLAQIWEDCFDLLELMESTLRKVTTTKT